MPTKWLFSLALTIPSLRLCSSKMTYLLPFIPLQLMSSYQIFLLTIWMCGSTAFHKVFVYSRSWWFASCWIETWLSWHFSTAAFFNPSNSQGLFRDDLKRLHLINSTSSFSKVYESISSDKIFHNLFSVLFFMWVLLSNNRLVGLIRDIQRALSTNWWSTRIPFQACSASNCLATTGFRLRLIHYQSGKKVCNHFEY